MRKIVFFILFTFSLANASNNSQATFADIKEAVFKLIVENKASKADAEVLGAKTEAINTKLEKVSASMPSDKKDSLDVYIENFVLENELEFSKLDIK